VHLHRAFAHRADRIDHFNRGGADGMAAQGGIGGFRLHRHFGESSGFQHGHLHVGHAVAQHLEAGDGLAELLALTEEGNRIVQHSPHQAARFRTAPRDQCIAPQRGQ